MAGVAEPVCSASGLDVAAFSGEVGMPRCRNLHCYLSGDVGCRDAGIGAAVCLDPIGA